jgi:hypothetical protein
MRTTAETRAALLLLVLLLVGGPLAHAQEEIEELEEVETAPEPEPEPEPEKAPEGEEARETPGAGGRGRIFFEAQDWVAQPTGLQYTPATEAEIANPFGTRVLGVPTGTDGALRARLGFVLPGSWGRVVGAYFSHTEEAATSRLDPGRFVFGQTATHPLFAGYANDGLADGFFSDSRTDLRDYRLELYRPAFRTARLSSEWYVGWRRAAHTRRIDTVYLATVPDLPAVIPPLGDACCPALEPFGEGAGMKSRFEGRGPAAGFDVRYDLWKDRLAVEGGIGLAVLRGEIDSTYTSVTAAYVCANDVSDPATGNLICRGGDIIGPPYSIFTTDTNTDAPGIQPLGLQITQVPLPIGLEGHSVSTSAEILDGTLGLRWRALGWLDVVAGFRSTRYSDVGIDLRPKVSTVNTDDTGRFVFSVQDVTETSRSVTYEGLYGGLTFYVF